MNTAKAYVRVAGLNIDVVRKDIKNLHISVYPPMGRVRVAAPARVDDEAIRLAVVQRLPWIKRERERLQRASRQSEREMVSGESHYIWGQRLRLSVVKAAGRIRIEVDGKRLRLHAPADTSVEAKRHAIERWYRKELKAAIEPLIAKWEPITGKRVDAWTVRRMKTKWGSCNSKTRHLWFNIELAKKHPACLEYLVVHEMAHLNERTHNEHFVILMDSYLPNWRALREELNGAPLSAEDW
jgi:predicted metal-dependent hydrolase